MKSNRKIVFIALNVALVFAGCATGKSGHGASNRAVAGGSGGSVDFTVCNQIVSPSELRAGTKELIKRNTNSAGKATTWNQRSHTLVRYFNGDTQKPSLIVIDGTNKLYPSVKLDDLLGKPISGYTAYNLQADTGEIYEWGASVFLDETNIYGSAPSKEGGRMVFREGQEEGLTDTAFWCNFQGGGIDDRSTYPSN
jgi:hypothetical protein